MLAMGCAIIYEFVRSMYDGEYHTARNWPFVASTGTGIMSPTAAAEFGTKRRFCGVAGGDWARAVRQTRDKRMVLIFGFVFVALPLPVGASSGR